MNNDAYFRNSRELCQHIQRDVYEASMQEDGGDKSADARYWPNPGVTICSPPPLIRFFPMELSMPTNFFDGTKLIRWVGGIIETWERI